MTPEEVAKVKKFIDTFFSNEWCRDNYIVPLSEENGYLKIAIANYSYLGTIAHPIRDRLIPSGLKCEFVERSFEEIGQILDLTLDEKFISGDPKYLDELEVKRKKEIEKEKKEIEKEKKLKEKEIKNILKECKLKPDLNLAIDGDEAFQIHMERLEKFGQSIYFGETYYVGKQGGIYTLSASGSRNYKY